MKKVLIVDDDLSFLAIIKHNLEKEKFEVYSCSSGEVALALLQSSDFDVVVSDYKMGQISGLALARSVKNRKNPLPIILLTAYAGGFWNSNWGNYPDKVLSKPVEFIELTDAINDLCNRPATGATTTQVDTNRTL